MRALAALAATGLALLLALPAVAQSPTPSPHPPHHNDAFVAPPRSAAPAGSGPFGMRGPSQYFAGEIAVRVVLPESDGSVDPSTEDWTPEQIAAVQASVEEALDWWADQLPLARLSFQVRTEVAPIAYEPTRYGLTGEGKWIGASLSALGFPGEHYFDQAYAAADSLRDELQTDWTTTIFVANSAHGSGYFEDGYFAYAYINGPFMVVTSDVGGYGPEHFAPIVAHELGHIFGALDQYAVAQVSCERRSGYLYAPTTNSQHNQCGTSLPSIMLEPVGAYAVGAVDPSARAQLGYHDHDDNGIIDPLDTRPEIEVGEIELAAQPSRPILQGTSADRPFPSPLQAAVSINQITRIEFRVDGGPWQPTAAADGGFDSGAEGFTAELPLYDGAYAVELRAVNSAGIPSEPVSKRISVSGVGPQPEYAVASPPSSETPAISLALSAPASTTSVQVSLDAGFAGAEWQPYTPELPFELPAPGEYTIYVRFRDAAGLNSLAYAAQTSFDPPGTTLFFPQLSR